MMAQPNYSEANYGEANDGAAELHFRSSHNNPATTVRSRPGLLFLFLHRIEQGVRDCDPDFKLVDFHFLVDIKEFFFKDGK